MDRQLKQPPPYAIASVDHALRIAAMLQLEGELTVSQAAARLGVARSTAHRLLAMLVYRDFAVQTDRRSYRAGLVLELATHSQSAASRLRTIAIPHMQELVAVVGESSNLIVRSGDTGRFIASVECAQSLRVGNREGMVFAAHRLTGSMVLLAELTHEQLENLYSVDKYADRLEARPDLSWLHREVAKVRSAGYALNNGRSERGVVALGRPVRDPHGLAVAGLSLSMPSVRFDPRHLPTWLAALGTAIHAIEQDLRHTHHNLR